MNPRRYLAASTPPSASVAVVSFEDREGLIEAMLDAVWLVDATTLRIVAANRAAGVLMAMPADRLVGQAVAELAATPEDECHWDEAARGLAGPIESQSLLLRADGSVAQVTRRVSRLVQADGHVLYVVALRDRSAQVATERALDALTADLRATLESTHDGILVTDLGGRIRHFNRRFAALWQVPESVLVAGGDGNGDGTPVREWMRASVVEPGTYTRRLAAIVDGAPVEATDTLRLLSGRVLERVTMPQIMQGQTVGRVFSFRDVTERLRTEQRIQTLSTTNPLTGLPNRRLLADRVEVALAAARRDGTPFAMLFLNIDRFKQVGDTRVRVFGDHVLRDVAERIKACMREVDTVAHLGGDEFVVLAHQADGDGAEIAAQRLIDGLQPPFMQDGMRFSVTASIGVSLFPSDGANLEELARRSDGALREVKAAGRAGFRFHQPRAGDGRSLARSQSQLQLQLQLQLPLQSQSHPRLQLDQAMRQALAREDFRLHYQPQVDFASGRVVGAEALLRWRDDELGEVAPAELIPAGEESGLSVAVGAWVLKTAVAQASVWRSTGPALPVAVNVSTLQFRQPGFIDFVAALLREAELPPPLLELELTEATLAQDAQDAMLRLQALAQLGVQIAIDDFGTGYSSLACLQRFPIKRLKVDRRFVAGVPASESDAGVVRAIVQMGHALRLQVVAEGVETQAQHDWLQALGCDRYQGHLFAPALDARAFEVCVGDTVPFPRADQHLTCS